MNLNDSVGVLPSVGPVYQKKLSKLGIFTLDDLLTHIPTRFSDYKIKKSISAISPGETVSLMAEVSFIKNVRARTGKIMQLATVKDETRELAVVWFNQPFLTKALYPGRKISLAGKVGFFGKKLALVSPEYQIVYKDSNTSATEGFVAVYPETAGISSKWLRGRVKYLLSKIKINEYLSQKVLKKYNLAPLKKAYVSSHFPDSQKDYKKGLKRLAFDELLFLHLESLERKRNWLSNSPAYRLSLDKKMISEFTKKLPFELTKSQKSAASEILSDLAKTTPMNRLLEGDVGSGKTVVAAIAAFATFLNGYQTLLMAPTQILAVQHYNTLKKIFDKYKLRIALLTSSTKLSDPGKTDVYVGTHSLINKTIKFDQVALTIIDEQHRFGVKQRDFLIKKSTKKGYIPHTLTMTATPIPRTIALTLYGDLDLSVLTDMPLGRQKITTWVVPPVKRKKAYEWISKEIKVNKSQVFVVCPLIDESEIESMVNIKSAKNEYENLVKEFPKNRVGLLHGKLKSKEKAEVLNNFKAKKIDILVSTPVIEVGVDIPNATIMVIETAERFGLAALHQLRGRVGRGKKKSYCLLFTESKNRKVKSRLSSLAIIHSGFELAELDLKLRGPGQIFGNLQHGVSELKIANWSDLDLIKSSKKFADQVFENPDKFPDLIKEIGKRLLVN